MAKSTKLEYNEYKALEEALRHGEAFREVREDTVDGMAYRKIIILLLGERELRFVGPWKHEYDKGFDQVTCDESPGQLEAKV